MNTEDYLQLSGIQHYKFCPRQWALIHIEQEWAENILTVQGKILHEHAHDATFTEKRGDKIITREMAVVSHELGVSGKCDVVEFHASADGVTLFGQDGLWLPYPVEYKHGVPKISDADRLQLCAQAICLEEMLLCRETSEAAIYYGKPHRREVVSLDSKLRGEVRKMFADMKNYYDKRYIPRVKYRKECAACSLKNVCLPKMPATDSVRKYIDASITDLNL
ncbi:CRISPR-associated protein Cas4 [Clostridia bacterium]|nr:CRISPR-associated protein Cas4 [Clostridia bacterium]